MIVTDVAAAGVNPLRHYMRYGGGEGRKPNPLFDPDYYLRRYPQLKGAGWKVRRGIEVLIRVVFDDVAVKCRVQIRFAGISEAT